MVQGENQTGRHEPLRLHRHFLGPINPFSMGHDLHGLVALVVLQFIYPDNLMIADCALCCSFTRWTFFATAAICNACSLFQGQEAPVAITTGNWVFAVCENICRVYYIGHLL